MQATCENHCNIRTETKNHDRRFNRRRNPIDFSDILLLDLDKSCGCHIFLAMILCIKLRRALVPRSRRSRRQSLLRSGPADSDNRDRAAGPAGARSPVLPRSAHRLFTGRRCPFPFHRVSAIRSVLSRGQSTRIRVAAAAGVSRRDRRPGSRPGIRVVIQCSSAKRPLQYYV
jgi:hypothetical protein